MMDELEKVIEKELLEMISFAHPASYTCASKAHYLAIKIREHLEKESSSHACNWCHSTLEPIYICKTCEGAE